MCLLALGAPPYCLHVDGSCPPSCVTPEQVSTGQGAYLDGAFVKRL